MSVSPRSGTIIGFSISVQYKISNILIFGAPYLHSWGDKTYTLADFFVRNSIPNNFYLNLFFDVKRIFGSIEA